MSFLIHNKLVVCFVLMFGLGLAGLPVPAAAQPGALPILSSAVASAVSPGTIEVSGERFSPGGLVYIEVYDEWGTTLRETRWVASSPTVHGPNGSQDPARGYVAGGEIRESFEQVRQTVYGPNGSQDPAQGYVRGDAPTMESPCDGPMMVQAYDRRLAAWSNMLEVESGC